MEQAKGMTSLDIYCAVREMQIIKDSKVEKIYQPDNDELVIFLYNRQLGKLVLKIISGKGVYLSIYKKESKDFPPHFCMFLRKHLTNATLRTVSQKNNDRIIEIDFDTKEGMKRLICELYSPGNFVLCDQDYNVVALKQVQVFRDRRIMVHKQYVLPEKGISVLTLNLITFKRALSYSRMGSVVKALASEIGLGGKYAEEICLRAQINKDKPLNDLASDDYEKLYNAIDALVRKLKYKPYEPAVVFENEKVTDYQPVPLDYYEKNRKEGTETFNRAVDEYYTISLKKIDETENEKKRESEREKLELIKEKQEERVEELEKKSEEKRELGSEIMNKISLLEQVRLAIISARNSGDSWDEINRKLDVDRKKGVEAALLVESVDPATRTFKVSDLQADLNIDSSVGSQASKLYEKAKQAEIKTERAKDQIIITENKIETLKGTPLEPVQEFRRVEQKEYSNWYEKFKYFYTSNNKLVVCGKDAVQNDILINRYMRDDDLVFHADVIGSPFGLLRTEGEEYGNNDLEEASDFVASHCRAWRDGFGTADVYWVQPSQVSKESGLQKGSFMIYGRRNYLYGRELKIAIGIQNGKIISGPENAVKNKTGTYCLIKPGDESQNDVALDLAEKLGVQDLDAIIHHLPSGNSKIIEPAQKQPAGIQQFEQEPVNEIPEETEKEEPDFEFEDETEEKIIDEEPEIEGSPSKSFLDDEIDSDAESKEKKRFEEDEEIDEEDGDFDYDDFSF